MDLEPSGSFEPDPPSMGEGYRRFRILKSKIFQRTMVKQLFTVSEGCVGLKRLKIPLVPISEFCSTVQS